MSKVRDKRQPAQKRDRNGGFTLVELLVVLVILGLVMSLVGPRVLNYLTSSRTRATTLQVSSLKSSLDLFYLDVGRYPSKTEGLAALVARPATAGGWNGPYLQQTTIPADPWGNAYQYTVPGDKTPFKITSLGADGVAGGSGADADITSN